MEEGPMVVPFRADALEACSIFTVVKGSVTEYFWSGAGGVGARDESAAFVEVPVSKLATGAFLSLAVQLGGYL